MIFVAFFSVQAIRGAEGHKDNAVTLILFCFFVAEKGWFWAGRRAEGAGWRVIYRCRRPPDGKRERIRGKRICCSTCNIDFIFFREIGVGWATPTLFKVHKRVVAWRGFSFYVKWHQKNDIYSSSPFLKIFCLFVCIFVCVFFLKK